MIQKAVLAHFGRFADHHAHAVVYEEPLGDFCSRVNFDSGHKPIDLRNQPCRELEFMPPQKVRDPMPRNRVQSRVGKHLPPIARGGIVLEYCIPIGSEVIEHLISS
jgi:hypothetical protein